MKTLKFTPELTQKILAGGKTSTWRLFDDKDLQVGDRLLFVNKETSEDFGEAVITSLKVRTLGTLTDDDWIGHERFTSEKEMYVTYRKYYGDKVDENSTVKILSFDLKSKKTKSAGGVVVNPVGDILVVSQHGNSWSLPKGHIELGEDAVTAAIRETKEESGITDLKLIRELGNYERYRIGKDGGEDKTELKQIFMFLFKTNQSLLKPIDPENPEARWINKDEVADLLSHPNDKEFFLGIKAKI